MFEREPAFAVEVVKGVYLHGISCMLLSDSSSLPPPFLLHLQAYSEALRVYRKVFGKEEHLSFAMTLVSIEVDDIALRMALSLSLSLSLSIL